VDLGGGVGTTCGGASDGDSGDVESMMTTHVENVDAGD
jgi:hypothetical protein